MNHPTTTLDLVKRFFVLALFALVSCSGFAQQADEIDSFLASPVPPAPIPEEIAKTAVDKGTALAANAAARRDEITAYLIPFQRVLGVPAGPEGGATATPETAAVVPTAKPFLIFKTSDGVAECFKAATVTTQGNFMTAQSPEGRKGMWQNDRFATKLPWYTDAEMEAGGIDLETLALRYKVSVPIYPAAKATLLAEMERIEAVGRRHREAADKQRATFRENAARVIAQGPSYSKEHDYSREELAKMLLEAEEVRKTAPDQAQKIDAAMAPFRVHFENLLANRVYAEGTWQSKTDWEAKLASKQAAEEEQAFEKDLHIEINGESVSPSDIRGLFGALVVAGAGIFILGLYLLVGQAGTPARALGIGLCLAPALLGIYWHSRLFANNPNPPSFTSSKPTGTNKVVRALYAASKPADLPVAEVDHRITLRESDLNSFLRENVHISSVPAQTDWALCRTDLAVQLLSDGVMVWELARFKGRVLKICYDLKTEGIGAGLKLADFKVTVGNLKMPRPLARRMLNNLTGELAKIKKGRGVLDAYQVTRLTDGETDLTSSPHVAQAPAVVAAPAPEAAAAKSALTVTPVPQAPAAAENSAEPVQAAPTGTPSEPAPAVPAMPEVEVTPVNPPSQPAAAPGSTPAEAAPMPDAKAAAGDASEE